MAWGIKMKTALQKINNNLQCTPLIWYCTVKLDFKESVDREKVLLKLIRIYSFFLENVKVVSLV